MQVAVKQGDTLASIALAYLSDASQADTLASYNNLEYPFIVDDPNYVKGTYATGTLSLTYTGVSVPYTLPIGAVFQSVGGASNEVRSYATTQQATFTATNQTVSIPAQCTVMGRFGNTLASTITQSPNYASIAVTNPSPFSGGRIYRVLVPGDFIQIPQQTTSTNTTPRSSLLEIDTKGGIDFLRTPTGGLQWATDDLAIIAGPEVVGQDIGAVIATPAGSISDNQTFGTAIVSSLGIGGDYAMQRIAVLGQGAAQADDRVKTVGKVTMTAQSDSNGTWIAYNMGVTLKTGQQANVGAQITA